MLKRFLSLFLSIMMVLSMIPVQVFAEEAAAEPTAEETVITEPASEDIPEEDPEEPSEYVPEEEAEAPSEDIAEEEQEVNSGDVIEEESVEPSEDVPEEDSETPSEELTEEEELPGISEETVEGKDSLQNTAESVAVSSVVISAEQDTTELKEGETLQLYAAVLPENATFPEVTWASSDESVAAVDQSGLVTAAAPGDVVITATADGVEGTYALTVAEQLFTVSHMEMEPLLDTPDNEEAFALYTEQVFYGNSVSLFGSAAGSRLSGDEKKMYDALVPYIKKLANGERASAVISMGQKVNTTDGLLTPEISVSFTGATLANGALNRIMDALLSDLPYELYWYDKTVGVKTQYVSAGAKLYYVEFIFTVASAYRGSSAYTVDQAKTSAPKKAAENAASIVNNYKTYNHYDKLFAYAMMICELVDYNYDALKAGTPYGDPWQLIHVFDGDPETNVVCEGYSKAFMYLCDLSDFDGTVSCYTVCGDMSGGAHMWNIVTIDGKNYLVDVTNSDSGAVGQNGGLFLVGGSGNPTTGYTFLDYIYTYDADELSQWGTDESSILYLAEKNYEGSCDDGHTEVIDQAVEATCQATGLTQGSHCTVCGETIVEQEVIPVSDHIFVDGACKFCSMPGGSCGDNLIWNFDEATGTLTVSGTGSMDKLGLFNSPWQSLKEQIKTLVLEDGVTSVGDNAFYYCKSLTSVTIPDSVTEIGLMAFSYTGLTSIYLPASVVTIDSPNDYEAAFLGCSDGMTIYSGAQTVPDGWGRYWDYISSDKKLICKFGYSYEDYIFWSSMDNTATTIQLPEGITMIPASAFSGWSSLKSVKIPSTVTSIGALAFSGTALEEVEFLGNCPQIAADAFTGVTATASYLINTTGWNSTTLVGYGGQISWKGYMHGTCGENLTWFFDDTTDTLTISGTGNMEDYGTQSMPWYSIRGEIKEIVFGDGVTSIGNQAFYMCTSLSSVTVPGNVGQIGMGAFTGCSQLKTVTIDQGVTYILSNAFSDCAALESVTIPDGLISIGDGAFQDCAKLKEIFIPSSVTRIGGSSIGDGPFNGCASDMIIYCAASTKPSNWGSYWNYYYPGTNKALTVYYNYSKEEYVFWKTFDKTAETIVIPQGYTRIPDSAFSGCTGLKSVTIPDSIVSIGSNAFKDCTGLKTIYIPGSVTTISASDRYSSPFDGCSSELTVYCQVSEAPSTWDFYWDMDSNINQLRVCYGCSAEEYALWRTVDKSAEIIEIPDGIVHIPSKAFWECEGLKSVTLPDTVTSIGNNAFSYCSSLEKITIPGNVKTISHAAFSNCTSLKELTIQNGLTTIGTDAFYGCTALTSIYIPSSVTSIAGSTSGDAPFYGCSPDLILYCGSETVISGWGSYWNIYDETGTLDYKLGYTYEDYLYWPSVDTTGETVQIPEGATTIPNSMFSGNTVLKSVTIPSTVTEIRPSAFYGCTGLTSVTIPANVTFIGREAFAECKNLTEIIFEHKPANELTFGTDVFNISYLVTKLDTTVKVPYLRIIQENIYEVLNGHGDRNVTWVGTSNEPIGGISVSEKNGLTEIECGLDLNLQAVLTPEGAVGEVLWSVIGQNGTIKSTDDLSAVVTATRPGDLTVRCTAADNEAVYGELTVTVKPGTAKISSITLSADSEFPGEAEVGKTLQLYADILPLNAANWNLTWEVSNGTGEATIDQNGLLTAEKCGTVTVYARAQDDSGVVGSYSLKIVRYAEKFAILLDGKENVTQIGVGQTMVLNAMVSPADATVQDFTWSVENGTGTAHLETDSDVNDIYYYLVGDTQGTVTVTVTSKDNRKKVSSLELLVVGETASYSEGISGGNIYYNTVTGAITGIDNTVTSATIPAKIGDVDIVSIAPNAFRAKNQWGHNVENTTLTSVILPDSITSIGHFAFYECTALTGLMLSSSLKSIGEWAFYGCESIVNLTIPNSVVSIGEYAFADCTCIETLIIPDSVVSIGEDAFHGLEGLKHLTVSGEKDTIDWLYKYDDSPLETLTLTGTKVVGCNLSYGEPIARGAKQVTIADTVQSIEDRAFFWCNSIQSVSVGKNVKTIDENAFHACSNMQSINLPEGLTTIGKEAFLGCGSLGFLELPESLTSIGESAFAECFDLEIPKLPDSLTYIGKDAFEIYNGKLQIIDFSGIPDTIIAKETRLNPYVIIPPVLDSATGGKTDIWWDVYQMDEDGTKHYADSIAEIKQDHQKGYIDLIAYSSGTVIVECEDQYTGASGMKEITIESGIEIRGIADQSSLVSGKAVTLNSWRVPANIKESVTWSVREKDKNYVTLSTSNGNTVKLTAKNVTKAETVMLTATPSNPVDATTITLKILPKATGIGLLQGESTIGQTGTTVQTVDADMHEGNTLQLTARVLPEGATEAVTWTSSATSIATVDKEGIVTLKKPGSVTIKAVTTDGTSKSASVNLNVTYLDGAKSLTAKAEVPSIGLQETRNTVMHVYGTDKETPIDPANMTFTIPESQQAIATVDASGTITAGGKPGTATVTAAITGDPLNRKVSVKVKVIAAQTEQITVLTAAQAPGEIIMLDAEGNETRDEALAVQYAVYVNKADVPATGYKFSVAAESVNTLGEKSNPIMGTNQVKWATTDSRVATVSMNGDGSATVTVKAKTDGACSITATSTDLVKVQGELTVHVRDYTPRLESTSLTLNDNLTSGVSTDLAVPYGRTVKSASLYEYDSKTRKYAEEVSSNLEAIAANDRLTIQAKQDVKLSNGTRKLRLVVTTDDGAEGTVSYEYFLTLKVANSYPAITIKQPAKFNLTTGTTGELQVTAKNAVVKNVVLADSNDTFKQVGEFENGVLTFGLKEAYKTSGFLQTKAELAVYLEGYKEPVTKTVTIGTTSKNPSITVKQSGKFNLFYKDSETVLTITAKNETITDVRLDETSTPSFAEISAYDADNHTLTLGFSQKHKDGEAGKLDASIKLLVYVEGINGPVAKSVNLSTATVKPTLTMSPASSIINTKLDDVHSTYITVYNKTLGEDMDLEAGDITVTANRTNGTSFAEGTVEGGKVCLTLTEVEGVVNKGGTAKIAVQPENWMQPVTLSHKLSVQETLPVPVLGASTLNLHSAYTEAEAVTTAGLNQGNMGIQDIFFEPAAAAGTATYEQADKIILSFANGQITARFKDNTDPSANGTYTFRYTVLLDNGTTELAAKTLKVTVKSTVPGVKLASTTLKLNKALEGYDEIAQTKVSLTSGTGYTLVGFQESTMEDGLVTFTYEEGFLHAVLNDAEAAAKKYSYKLTPVVMHNESQQILALTTKVSVAVQVHDTLPSATLKTGTLKLNRVFTQQSADTLITLNQKLASISGIDVESTAKNTTDTWKQANKIQFALTTNEAGQDILTASILDGADAPKNGTYTYRYVVHLSNGRSLAAKTFKVTVSSTVPTVKLASSTLKLNRTLGEYADAETKVSLTNGKGYVLTDLLLPDDWTGEKFSLTYDPDTSVLKATLANGEVANSKTTVALVPVVTDTETGEEVTLSSTVKVTVQVYTAKPSVTLSAKGKLDALIADQDLTGGAIRYTVTKMSNISGIIDGVSLDEESAGLFHAEVDNTGSKPVITITKLPNVQYATNKTYKVKLTMSISGQDVVNSLSIKVSQSGLKFGSVGTLKLYQFQKTPLSCTLNLNSPVGGKLSEITINQAKTSSAFLKAMDGRDVDAYIIKDGEAATLDFRVKNPGYLTYGKSYTVYLDVTPEGNASNVKPTQVKLTVKAYK